MERFFSFWHIKRNTLHIIIENNLTDVLFARIVQNAYGRHEGSSRIPDGQDEAALFPLVLTFSFYGLASLLLRWHSHDYATPPQQMANTALHLLTHPLFYPEL